MRFKRLLLAVCGVAVAASALAQPINDPAKQGMKALPMVDGCNVPGGLTPITSSDGPNDAAFWCGANPPYCLTMPVGSNERCHIIPGSRNGGLKGVRDPDDLICDVVPVQPTGGHCPVPPTVTATVNGATSVTMSQGASAVLAVDTSASTGLSALTSLTMSCSGANSGLSPFSVTNLSSIAGTNYTYPGVAVSSSGATTCTVTAVNVAGTAAATFTFTATPVAATPAPTITAQFRNSPVPSGDKVTLRTRTSNATGTISYRCTGAWTGTYSRSISNGGWYQTYENQGSGATAGKVTNCTFTVSGPGGTASTTASWTAAGSGSGSGGSGSGASVGGAPRVIVGYMYSSTGSSGNGGADKSYAAVLMSDGVVSQTWGLTFANPPSLNAYYFCPAGGSQLQSATTSAEKTTLKKAVQNLFGGRSPIGIQYWKYAGCN